MVHITNHAIERYQERVSNLPEDIARSRIEQLIVRLSPLIPSSGSVSIKLPSGQRIIIVDQKVITITAKPKSGTWKGAR